MDSEPKKLGINVGLRNEKGQFVKGHPCISGGAGGRPRRQFMEMMDEAVTDEDWKSILIAAKEAAKENDAAARDYLSNRKFGKVTDKVQVEGEIIQSLRIIV